MSCCYEDIQKPIIEWSEVISKTDLTDIQKRAIRIRVLSVVKRLRDRLGSLSAGYFFLRTSTTVGSLLVPSLLAVQANVDQMSAYWAMWSIGLLVSLSNAFVSLFRIDKNYFTVGDLIEKIESEAWMFLTLSGRYKYEDIDEFEEGITGHQAQFANFMERCEIMMNKAIRTEYIPGQIPTSNRGTIADQHSLMEKRLTIQKRQLMVPGTATQKDPYETVSVQVDDKHDSGASGSGGPVSNIREPSMGSDSTIEDDRGIPIGRDETEEGVVPTFTGSQGIPVRPENRSMYGHYGEGSKE
jgi:hypothetical protein